VNHIACEQCRAALAVVGVAELLKVFNDKLYVMMHFYIANSEALGHKPDLVRSHSH